MYQHHLQQRGAAQPGRLGRPVVCDAGRGPAPDAGAIPQPQLAFSARALRLRLPRQRTCLHQAFIFKLGSFPLGKHFDWKFFQITGFKVFLFLQPVLRRSESFRYLQESKYYYSFSRRLPCARGREAFSSTCLRSNTRGGFLPSHPVLPEAEVTPGKRQPFCSPLPWSCRRKPCSGVTTLR